MLLIYIFSEECNSTVTVGNLSTSDAFCHLDETCNQVDCCITVPELQEHVHVFFYLYFQKSVTVQLLWEICLLVRHSVTLMRRVIKWTVV